MMTDYSLFNKDAVAKVQEISRQIREEENKEAPDRGMITRLMFEQMLQGLYLTQQ